MTRGGDNGTADPLAGIVDSVIRRSGEFDWKVTPGEFWCRVEPAGTVLPKQGWKLHVSATVLAAPLVLHRAAEVLVAHRASFKYAGTLGRVSQQGSGQAVRGAGGKFITVYPYDDEQFRCLADELATAVAGLPGPGVLSDRQFRPDSGVFYRYGAFTGTRVLTNDGTFDVRIEAPDGRLVKDSRRAWFSPPAWASSPLPEPEAKPAAGSPSAVLLNDRYVVRRAIRHAYKGGVYLGVDQRDGGEVVIKEARRHVGSMPDGTDVQDMLRNEAEVLAALEPLGSCPRPVETFRQGTSLFVVQERIAGETLRNWIAADGPPPRALVLDLADQMVAVVEGVHAAGFALRDFNPNNLMVTPERVVRLIDLEMAARPGTTVWRSFTPGYAGPEIVAAGTNRITADPAADRYALGAVLFHLASGADPLLIADEPVSRPMSARLEPLISGALAGEMGGLIPLVLGLMADEPAERWSLEEVRTCLGSLRRSWPGAPSSPAGAPVDAERMLGDGLEFLLDTARLDATDRLWPAEGFSAMNDPLNVQHGAGGVLAVLASAAELRGGDRLRSGVADVARWIVARLGERPQALPGLYFGRSGTAWALLDAARVLGDDDLATAAVDLARAVPVRWPNPDVCHGAAGAGLTQLHFWRATGDPDFRDRALDCADGLVAAAEERPAGVVWPIPAGFDSELAGVTHFGFGHGVAGIGTFLLLTGAATGRDDLVALARRAGDTLERTAVRDGDAAYWPVTAERPGRRQDMLHWCSGSSGVGTFLIRLWRACGEDRFRELAEAGATAIHRMRWLGSPVACHGLSGNADFLLDLADALDEPRYRRWAEDLLACVHARHAIRDGRMVVPDQTMFDVSADYQTGLAGVLGFLLRRAHGGPRRWLPEPADTTALIGAAA